MSLENVRSVLSEASRLSGPLTLEETVRRLSLVKTSLGVLAPTVRDKDLKRRLVIAHNKTDSLIGGLQTLDYTKGDVLKYHASLTSLMEDTLLLLKPSQRNLAALKDKHEADVALGGEDADQDAIVDTLLEGDATEATKKLERLFRDAPEALKRYADGKEALRKLHSKDFVFVRAPIVPILTTYLSDEKLQASGFGVGRIGAYAVLENQLVLGLNSVFVEKSVKTLKKTKEELAEFFLHTLNKRTGKHYEIVKGFIYKEQGWYCWISPAKELKLIREAAGGGKFQLREWNFAF